MLRRASILAALVLLGASCTTPPFGRDTALAAEHVALAIGNGHYINANALPNPANDAKLIARSLQEIGFAVTVGVDVNHDAMEKLLREFVRNAASAKVAVLFYAGHGMQVAGRNYLIPVDAKLDTMADLQFETIELDKVLAGLDDPARANIIILDACRDNPLARSFAQRGGPTRSAAVGSGLAGISAVGTGTLIAFATAPDKVALDGQGANSPFSASFAKHVASPGLEVRQLMTRVRAEVAAATGNKQIPWDNSSLLGDVFLAGKGQTLTAVANISPTFVPQATPAPPPLRPTQTARLAPEPSGFLFSDSDRRRLSFEELRGLSSEQLRIARNEIFARRGRFFRDAGLRQHFSHFSWYRPRAWDVQLNEIENANVKLIQSMGR